MKKKICIILSVLLFVLLLFVLKVFATKAYYSSHPINIVYTTDVNYKDYLKVSLNSLVENKSKDTIYNVYILCVDLAPAQTEMYKAYNSDKVHVKTINLNLDTIKNVGNYKVTYHVTRADLFKFFMPEIFPELDKILYLDVDTVILKDLSGIYYTHLGNKYLGVVTKCVPKSKEVVNKFGFKYTKKTYYYNCGVLLYNLKKWREDDITSQLIDAKNKDTKRSLMTQNVFNEVLDSTKVKRVSPIYNVLTQWNHFVFYMCNFRSVNWQFCFNIKSSEDLFEKAVIVHFVDANKPWKANVPYSYLWHKYEK